MAFITATERLRQLVTLVCSYSISRNKGESWRGIQSVLQANLSFGFVLELPVFLMQYVLDQVYVHMCAPVWVGTQCIHACEGAQGWQQVSSHTLPHTSRRTSSSPARLVWPARAPYLHTPLCSPRGSDDLSPSLSFTTSTLPTEPSPQPKIQISITTKHPFYRILSISTL